MWGCQLFRHTQGQHNLVGPRQTLLHHKDLLPELLRFLCTQVHVVQVPWEMDTVFQQRFPNHVKDQHQARQEHLACIGCELHH
jgi:hypothetical protein